MSSCGEYLIIGPKMPFPGSILLMNSEKTKCSQEQNSQLFHIHYNEANQNEFISLTIKSIISKDHIILQEEFTEKAGKIEKPKKLPNLKEPSLNT